jgi:microcystin-dependent protein
MSARNSYNVAPIQGDNNGGSGGGGGDPVVVGGGIPIGSILPFAGFSTPVKWMQCNGAELNLETYNELFGAIGYNYGINPGIGFQGGITSYSTPTTSAINFALTSIDNYFIVVGTILKLSGFTAITGPNINGLLVTVTAAPAINARGTISATFSTPLPATGDGGVGTLNRITFKLPDLRLASPIGYQTGTIGYATSGGASTYQLNAQNLPQHRHGVFVPGGLSSQVNGSQNRAGDPNVDAAFTTVPGETYPDTGALTPVGNTAFSIRNPYVAVNYIIRAED